MTEKFEATATYNDLLGDIAIDGYEGPFLLELARMTNMPSSYWPIGFSIYSPKIDSNGNIKITIVAIRHAQAGNSMDEVIKYFKENESITVHPYYCKIGLAELYKLMKRLSITVLDRKFHEYNIRVDHDDPIENSEEDI